MLSNTQTRRVEWGDCDPAGIVFNPQFFRWFDHGTTLLYEAAGWPKQEMLARFKAAGCPLVDTRAVFKRPCKYGDDVRIVTSIKEVRTSSFDISHQLFLGDTLCVDGSETRVWTVKDPDTGRLKSAPLPAELVARFNGD